MESGVSAGKDENGLPGKVNNTRQAIIAGYY